jgi:aspartyl/asparaginyl-tRNA synthetase
VPVTGVRKPAISASQLTHGVKAFYMQPDPERPHTVLACDLIAPKGHGEIVDGSQRMHDYSVVLDAINAHKLPRAANE